MNDADASPDLEFDPATLTGAGVVRYLDSRVQDVLHDVERSEWWPVLSDPASDSTLVREIMKEVYLEIVMYQPHVIEATIATIAQMPRTLDVGRFGEMLHHQVEEFDHGEMALRDYVALGGDEAFARRRRISPTAFSVAAMWRMLCHLRDPFAYLGALYPFEGLTPIIAEKVRHLLRESLGDGALGFLDYHATADLEHTETVRGLIEWAADSYPQQRASICMGINYFLAVYPMPGWSAAYRRARERVCPVSAG